eukprot:COSAG05_NODE_8601_length_689_cov_1.000000_1_plen_80_part_00
MRALRVICKRTRIIYYILYIYLQTKAPILENLTNTSHRRAIDVGLELVLEDREKALLLDVSAGWLHGLRRQVLRMSESE